MDNLRKEKRFNVTSKPQKKKEVTLKRRERSRQSMRRSKCTCGDAASFLPLPVNNHSFSLSFSNTYEKQNKSDLLVDYERWEHRLRKETECCICENRIVAKSYNH